MSNSLLKLKEKEELNPSYVATQEINFPVYTFDLNKEINSEHIVEVCKRHQKDEYREKSTDVIYAWRSKNIQPSVNNIDAFNKLLDIVEQKIKLVWNHCKNINSNIDCGFRSELYTFSIHNYWFTIYGQGEGAKEHSHTGIDLVAVYYASVPKNASPLIMSSSPKNITIDIKKGMLVIFSGLCTHMVPANSSNDNDERIVMSFNAVKKQF